MKSPRRKTATAKQAVEILLAQGAILPCYRCRQAMTSWADMEREHPHEMALGGADEPDNWQYSHSDCHHPVTNGTAATTYGSSKHTIAKAKRIDRKNRGESRPKQKIQSRNFQKAPDGHKHFQRQPS